MIGWIAACVAAGAGALTLVRLFIGPTLHDRALSALGVATHMALFCGALALANGDARFVDVAFALLIGALVAAAAILKFFRARSFQPALTSSQGE
jgi:multicomponent Na+:H+ antiporter subunit F